MFTSKDKGLSVSVSLTVPTRRDLFSGSGPTCTIDVLLCALCRAYAQTPLQVQELLTAPQNLFHSSLALPMSHSLSSHSSDPLGTSVALHQTHSSLSVPLVYWGCPKLPVVFPVALKSAGEPWFPWIRVAVLLLVQPSVSLCTAFPGCRDVFVHTCSPLMSHPPATQPCKASFMCTHACVGTHTRGKSHHLQH